MENIKEYPALRLSGILYLLGQFSGKNIFNEKNFSFNEELLIELLLNNDIPKIMKSRLEYYKHKNITENLRYHEGVFGTLQEKLLKEDISKNMFLLKVNELLLEELLYLEDMARGASLILPQIEKKRKDKQLKKILKNKKLKECFLLTLSSSKHLFKRKKRRLYLNGDKIVKGEVEPFSKEPLYLKDNKLTEGVLISGNTGSGKSLAALSLFAQNILKGNGGFYLSTKSGYDFNKIYAVAKSINREDDVMFFNLNNFHKMRLLNIKDLIKNNKIIVLTINEGFQTQKECDEFYSLLLQYIFLKIQEVENDKENNFMFLFEDVFLYLSKKHKEIFDSINDLAKRKNLIRVFTECNLVRGEHFLKYISHHFILRQDALEGFEKDIENLNIGDFYYVTDFNDKNSFKMRYIFFYYNMADNDVSYFNMY